MNNALPYCLGHGPALLTTKKKKTLKMEENSLNFTVEHWAWYPDGFDLIYPFMHVTKTSFHAIQRPWWHSIVRGFNLPVNLGCIVWTPKRLTSICFLVQFQMCKRKSRFQSQPACPAVPLFHPHCTPCLSTADSSPQTLLGSRLCDFYLSCF